MPVLVALCLAQKVPAIGKEHAITASCVLCRILIRKDHCRIVLVARGSPAAANRLTALRKPCPLEIPLHRMTPAEADEIILPAHEVQTCRRSLFDADCLRAQIADLSTARDDIRLLKNPVQQLYLNAADGIF